MNLPYAVLLAFLALVLVVSVPQSVDEARHSAYNENPQGLGHLFETSKTEVRYDERPVRFLHGDVKDLDPQLDALLITGPRISFSEGEVNRVEAFLRQGGRLLLLDDRGSGRGLLDGLGVGLSIPEGRIFSTSYQNDPAFVLAESTGAFEDLPETVVLHEPRPVLGDTGQTLLRSHPLSWLDRNNNGRPDLDEPRQAWALAKTVHLGAGQLVVVGDPDLLTERLAASPEGSEAQRVLLDWATQGGRRTLVIDEGHRAVADPLGITPMMAGDAPIAATVIVLAVVAATIVVAFRIRLTRVTPKKRPPHQGRPKDALGRAVWRELERS